MFRASTVAVAFALAASLSVLAACGSGPAVYPVHPTDALVARGRPLYEANCASCHGDATTRPPLKTAPTHQADGHTWHHPDRLLVEWVLDGVPLSTVMPRWRGKLSEDEARAVIAYIKTFWPEEIRDRQTEGSAEYEKQLTETRR
jgi:mono/diheme cytochrome c family protein